MADLQRDLAQLLNFHGREQHSNTPDFILARFLLGCLGVFGSAMKARDKWYGIPPEQAAAEFVVAARVPKSLEG